MSQQQKPKIPPPRTHVTLAYTGDADVEIKVRGAKPLTLKPGDNKVPLGLWHAMGGTDTVQALIGAGALRAVCRDHEFPTVDEDGVHELRNSGFQVNAGDDHPEFPHCKYCGHTRETAAEDVKQRAFDETAEGKAAIAEARAEREAAATHHAEVLAVLAKDGHEAAKQFAANHPGNRPEGAEPPAEKLEPAIIPDPPKPAA